MKQLLRLCAIGAVGVGVWAAIGAFEGTAAQAQDRAQNRSDENRSTAESQPAQESAEQQVTRYSFTDDLVRGDLVRPDGEVLTGRRRGWRDGLIRIREHFVHELLKSVEDI